MDKVLIDTDVILDFLFDRRPYSDYASKVFSLCELQKIEGFVTPECYLKSIAERKKSPFPF